ncbi:MAG: thioredoxin [Candidatus Gracilibacteria bacterium]
MALQFTDQNFKTETAKGFAVLDMYADWCGPCRMMMPIFEEIAKSMEGKVKMGKLNVDESPQTPGTFGVSGIPTIVFLKDGQEVGRAVGFQSKEALMGKITELFGVK